MLEERIVRLRARTVFGVLAAVLAVAVMIEILSVARQVLTWILIAIFLALALNPAVEFFQRHGIRRRGLSVATTFLIAIAAVAALAATFIPALADQMREFAAELPGYVSDLTEGRGPLGDLEERYDITERVREAVTGADPAAILGASGTALAVTKGVVTAIVAVVTIVFMTFFMLLEGPTWVERLYGLLPAGSRARWEDVGQGIYRTVGGYVTGNLTISVIAGVVSSIVLTLADVPYALALGLLVALLDLIPLAGATLAAVLVTLISFLAAGTTSGIIVLVFFVLYQQLENHVLQPLVYGRTVQLSPLAVLIAVLLGAELAGVLGALGAIPIAGTIQVVLRDWLRHRRVQIADASHPAPETA